MLDNEKFVTIILGLIFVITGLILYYFPPKKINYLYGYRTKNSMKNLERWTFAQRHSAKLMMYCGSILLITGIAGIILKLDDNLMKIVGLAELIILVAFLFIKTETDINRKFGKIV